MKPFYSLVRGAFKLIFRSLYHHQISGLENIPIGAAIIAPNHASFWDPPLIGASCPDEIHYLARSTLFNHILFSLSLEKLNAIPVQSISHNASSLRAVLQLLQAGNKVVIFPEGKRTPDGQLKKMKTGVALIALRSGCPIIPTYISGTFAIWPRNKKLPKLTGQTGCYFGKPIDPQCVNHLTKQEAIQELTHKLTEALASLQVNTKC